MRVNMNDKHFSIESITKLRSEKRISFLDPQLVVEKCLEISGLKSGTILDIGTGTGLFAEFFQTRGFNVTGIDDSEVMVKEAKRLLPACHFVQASADQIPFSDNQFDLSIIAHLLHEVDDPEAVLKEAKRVTKSNIFVLEWIYRKEEMGPPLEHRLNPDFVINLFKKIDIDTVNSIQVKNMMLYYS